MSSFTTCVKLVGDSNVIQMNIRPTIELGVKTPYNESCMKARQARGKRVAALYACQVGSAGIRHLCFMSATLCRYMSLTQGWPFLGLYAQHD